jgi:O-succinylbenzoate synthase
MVEPHRRIDVFSIPMTVRFRGVEHREGMLIHGRVGVGEFSPFWDYGLAESAAWLAAALEVADLGFPTPVRDRVPVNCTVPAVDPAAAAAIASGPHGCTTAKVKVAEPGQSLDDDVARVAAVRDALGPSGRVRIDANGGWDVTRALEAIAVLSEFDLEYVEQPTASIEDLIAVRRKVGVPIAADESIRRGEDPLQVSRLGAADIAVLIAMPVVVSSALETSIGIAAGVALAAALPELPYACGLGTTTMLTRDVVANPLAPDGGSLPVIVPALLPHLVEKCRADGPTTSRWRERLDGCQAVLRNRGLGAAGSSPDATRPAAPRWSS